MSDGFNIEKTHIIKKSINYGESASAANANSDSIDCVFTAGRGPKIYLPPTRKTPKKVKKSVSEECKDIRHAIYKQQKYPKA